MSQKIHPTLAQHMSAAVDILETLGSQPLVEIHSECHAEVTGLLPSNSYVQFELTDQIKIVVASENSWEEKGTEATIQETVKELVHISELLRAVSNGEEIFRLHPSQLNKEEGE